MFAANWGRLSFLRCTGISLVMLLLSAYGAVVQFAPAIVCALYVRRAPGKAVLGGLLVGAAVTLLFVLFKEWQPYKLHAGLYGLAANMLTITVLTARDRRAALPRAQREFLETAATPSRAVDD